MHMSDKKIAITIGVLFIVATVGFGIGQSIYLPYYQADNFLEEMLANKHRVVLGLLIETLGILAIPLIAVVVYQYTKSHMSILGLSYVVFRLIEGTLLLAYQVCVFSVLEIANGETLVEASNQNTLLQITGILKTVGQWSFNLSVSIVFPIGAMAFYFILYRLYVVPRLISVWGFLSVLWLLAGSILIFFNVFDEANATLVEVVLVSSIAVNEMVLALWLIVKGFNKPLSN